jgi:hypothetical protein
MPPGLCTSLATVARPCPQGKAGGFHAPIVSGDRIYAATAVGPGPEELKQWGFASSPVIHDGKVIVLCDVLTNSFVAAFDLASGSFLRPLPPPARHMGTAATEAE